MSNFGTQLKDAPGQFTFNVTSLSGTYSIQNAVPRQVLTLKNIRVEFDTSAHALASQNLKIKFPFISSLHVIDGDTSRFNIVVPLNNAVVTQYATNQKYWMSHDIHENFQYFIIDEAGSTVTGFTRVTLQFEFEQSSTS